MLILFIFLLSAGDSLTSHNDLRFSTFDKDQDSSESNCAKLHLGAFWYANCLTTNPNGVYLWGEDPTHDGIGVVWHSWAENLDVSLKSISLKIKSVS